MRQLYVYMNECKAGVLTEKTPGSGYTFCYEKDYLLSDNPAISVTLPKRNEPYEDKHMFPFFTNMIPEGANRKVISSVFSQLWQIRILLVQYKLKK